jgi:hypothetical protein
MTQQNEPDAELLLSKQRGILSPHEDEQNQIERDKRTRAAEMLEDDRERGHVGDSEFKRSKPD